MDTVKEAQRVAEYQVTEAALATLRQNYTGKVFAVGTKEGMKAAIEARATLRGYRVSLEKRRQEIKEPVLQQARLIDSEAKRITTELERLEDPIDLQITAQQRREQEAKDAAIRAERERIEAEDRAKKEAEERRLAEDRAKLERERAAFAEEQRLAEEAAAKIAKALDAAARESRQRIEAEEAASRKRLHDEEDRARAIRQAEEDHLARERRAIEDLDRVQRETVEAREREARRRQEEAAAAARREQQAREEAEAARQRAEQEEQAAAEREILRLEAERLDARHMLEVFIERYSHRSEFGYVIVAMRDFLSKNPEKKAA